MSSISLYYVTVLCWIPFYEGSNYILSYLFGHPHFGHKSKMQMHIRFHRYCRQFFVRSVLRNRNHCIILMINSLTPRLFNFFLFRFCGKGVFVHHLKYLFFFVSLYYKFLVLSRHNKKYVFSFDCRFYSAKTRISRWNECPDIKYLWSVMHKSLSGDWTVFIHVKVNVSFVWHISRCILLHIFEFWFS